MSDDPKPEAADFAALIRKARADYLSLSEVDRALVDSAQRRSLIRGLGGLTLADVLADEVIRLRQLVIQLGGDPNA